MNPKRLVAAIAAAFLCYFLTDYVIHGVWLLPDYKATPQLWRTDPEMQQRFGAMFCGHLLFAVAFVMIWARGFAATGCTRCALMFGFMMGLFFQAGTLITYVVTPIPADLAVKWFVSGLAQTVLIGLITRLVYKPAPQTGPSAAVACPV